MSDQPPESRPVLPPDPDAHPTQALPAQGATANAAPVSGEEPTTGAGTPRAKERLRDRLWSFRSVIAVALASVIIGGLGGAALAQVSEGDNHGRFGPGQGGFGRGGPGGPPGMMNGGPQNRQFPDRRGMGQRQWDQGGQPGQPVTPYGSAPPAPTATPSN